MAARFSSAQSSSIPSGVPSGRQSGRQSGPQSGNVFFALFGAIALIAVLGAGVMVFMKGPLATSVRLTRQNTAENQMSIAGQVAVMASANTASNGDCDGDGFVEPIEWRDPGTTIHPTGGGLVPSTIGISKKDPWGTEYGYCVWDHGPVVNGAGCGGATQKRLAGTNATGYPVVALISAGPDKIFTTTCRTFAAADVNSDGNLNTAGVDLPLVSKASDSDDDIIFTYTYDEATGASGGLWTLKSGAPGTATINKNIEVSGTGTFQRLAASGSDYLELLSGLKLPSPGSMPLCNATNAGVMRRNASGTGIEICDGVSAWAGIAGGSAAASTFNNTSAACDSTTVGQVRYNSVSTLPEFCNGTAWLPFTINVPGVNLVISPTSSNAMTVDGSANQDTATCTVASTMSCGAGVTFTITNQGTTTSAALAVTLGQIIGGTLTTVTNASSPAMTAATNATNFVITSNTCTGATLATNATCVVVVKPKANGNTAFSGTLNIIGNNNPFAIMQGTSTNFGCVPGRTGGGGVYAGCGLTDPDTGATYNLVVMPGGCGGSTANPTCSGSDTAYLQGVQWSNISYDTRYGGYQALSDFMASVNSQSNGAKNTATLNALWLTAAPINTSVAQRCWDMNYGGYSDWYLPSVVEMQNYIYTNRAAIGGFQNSSYWTSSISGGTNSGLTTFLMTDFSAGGTSSYSSFSVNRYYRCARRDNIALPNPVIDTNPDVVSITPSVSFSSGGTALSNIVTVSGITQGINVSITGAAGNPGVKVNGAAAVPSASGVPWGATLQFQMDVPTVLGTKNTATITIGDSTYTWWVGYADSSRTIHIFATSYIGPGGDIGALSGADTRCSSAAAASSLGLASKWIALMSDDTTNAADRIPWNWGTMKNVVGTTITTGGFSGLWDGTLDAPVGVNENGVATSSYVYTGTSTNGMKDPSNTSTPIGGSYHVCVNWTNRYSSTGGYTYAMSGLATSQSATWTAYGLRTCSTDWSAVYCVEDINDASDNIPSSITIPYAIQVPVGSRQASAPIIIGGMSANATTTLSVTATAGNPTFTVNGGAEVASASVKNGDSIVFKLDAPATGNSSNKMTITAAGSTVIGYWRVWTGDTTGTAVKRIFVFPQGNWYCGFGGLATADSNCTSAASAAGLGGSWGALISGYDEPNWAVNRIGYNWSTLKGTDGNNIVTAGNIWSTASTPLLNPVVRNAANNASYYTSVFTNTDKYGKAIYQTSLDTCDAWTVSNWSSTRLWYGTSSVTSSSWLSNGVSSSTGGGGGTEYYYCVEK